MTISPMSASRDLAMSAREPAFGFFAANGRLLARDGLRQGLTPSGCFYRPQPRADQICQ
jgi:hypothetical protein